MAHFRPAFLGNWRVSGIYTYASGRPFTMTLGAPYNTDIDPFGAHTAVPNVIGTPIAVENVDCWFYVSKNKACQALRGAQPDAFANPALGSFGNSGRNTMRGPHTNVFDASLMKNIPFGERINAQLRWEVFNVGNQVLFGQPNSQLTSGAVGQITSLAGDQRLCSSRSDSATELPSAYEPPPIRAARTIRTYLRRADGHVFTSLAAPEA